jgi:hypothetical protein
MHLSSEGKAIYAKIRYRSKFVANDGIDDVKEKTTIFVIGSGASADAGLPMAHHAIDIILKELNISVDQLNEQINDLLKISNFSNLPKEAFETQMLAISQIRQEPLRTVIQRLYKFRYIPLLRYEIIAHMFKHRFIDAIINFNFDELLDQSIDDELGPGEYYKIVSDGDCPNLLLDPDIFARHHYRSNLPVYIKPHGTASHISTLRFTRRQYYEMPADIKAVIHNMVKASRRPVTFVVIGFSMRSGEFNEIITSPHSDSKIFYINTSDVDPDPPVRGYVPDLIKVDREPYSLDRIMQSIWIKTSSHFKDFYKPRNICRHELITAVFEGLKTDTIIAGRNLKEYLQDRTVVEFILSVAKAKGLINLSEIAEDRCGKYYDLLIKYRRTELHPIQTFTEMIRDFGFQESEYGHEIFRLKHFKSIEETLILDKKNLYIFMEENMNLIYDIYVKYKPRASISDNETVKALFNETVDILYSSENTEIITGQNKVLNKIFKDATIVNTQTALKWHTIDLLEQDWNMLLVVAETGEWIINKTILEAIAKKTNISIALLVADMSRKKEIKAAFKKLKGCRLDIRRMNWWEHNRHMTIALRNMLPIGSVYFSRRLRASQINPIILDELDTQVALKVFCAYLLKADIADKIKVDYSKIENHIHLLSNLFNHSKSRSREPMNLELQPRPTRRSTGPRNTRGTPTDSL